MGILDDAIREHLELKRRRGADPDEIERAEREALGPVRRLPEEPAEPALEDDHLDEDEMAYEDEEWSEVSEEGAEASHSAEHAADGHGTLEGEVDEPEPPSTPRASIASQEPHKSPGPPPHPAGGLSDETAEYDVEREGDDVLEETPEFLQDTPDHDRLWFEQRPPRDFDFEG